MCNWGMTEIGPVAINTIFDSPDKVQRYQQQALDTGSLMGDRYYCDYKIENGCLLVKAETCIYPDWFNTQDRIALNSDGAMYHLGRAPMMEK